jgi:hypothetical protein
LNVKADRPFSLVAAAPKRRAKPVSNMCKRRTNGATALGAMQFCSSASAIGARRLGFETNGAHSKALKSVRLSRHRISFVALCVELDTDEKAATAAMVGSAFFAHARAASFLRHKLWRIRNIALEATFSGPRRSAQVFDCASFGGFGAGWHASCLYL